MLQYLRVAEVAKNADETAITITLCMRDYVQRGEGMGS